MKRCLALCSLLAACDPSGDGGPGWILPGELVLTGDLPDAAAPDGGLATRADPVPQFASVFYFDLTHVERISRFRSGIGHDYADTYETCRSMKHYICPNDCDGPNSPPPGSHDPAWTELELHAPMAGSVLRTEAEQSIGTQLVLSPDGHPDIRVKLFHVTPASGIEAGARFAAGQLLGTHASDLELSDVAVEQDLVDGFRLVSFFDVLTDAAFAPLVARGVSSRQALQITAAERDTDPLSCDGERFLGAGSLENWVQLSP